MTVDIETLKFGEDGLLPCIAYDLSTKKVLMLAYMNKEAVEKTLDTGEVTYFSRSRNKLWTKGETSGNKQLLKSLKMDCDRDTLLAEVIQTGVACHTGDYSCFYPEKEASENRYDVLTYLIETVRDRKKNPKEGSYTNYLFKQGLDKILKKIGEEATEVVIASKNGPEEVICETADLLYHLVVLLEFKEIDFNKVLLKLEERR